MLPWILGVMGLLIFRLFYYNLLLNKKDPSEKKLSSLKWGGSYLITVFKDQNFTCSPLEIPKKPQKIFRGFAAKNSLKWGGFLFKGSFLFSKRL